jgi:RHS repeat-associated protein
MVVNRSLKYNHCITRAVASTIYTSTRLEYGKNGQTVTYVIGELWQAGAEPGSCPINFQMSNAREFRYDSGRARYLNRQVDTDALEQNPPVFSVLSETWTDYDGDESYGDFTVSGGTASNARSFELGVATVDPWQPSTGSLTKYYHPDLIGTTRWMSTAAGSPTQSTVYTAFGERISGTNHRYGYAGEWGYQSHTEFPFLHVGARYYDPSAGRFLQRDPLGLRASFNLYEYARSVPSDRIDPDGMLPMDPPTWYNPWKGYDPLPGVHPRPPTPREAQKFSQWVAGGCAIAVGVAGWPITGAVVGGVIIVEDILEYFDVLPPAPDTWSQFLGATSGSPGANGGGIGAG